MHTPALLALLALSACGEPEDTGAPHTGDSLADDTAAGDTADDTAAADDTGDAATAQITGIAYQFMSHVPLEGAAISLAERPEISAVSDAEGRFTLTGVPLGEAVTPTVSLAEHVTAHHQRFTLDGDLDQLYFQVVPVSIYEGLAAGLAAGGLEVDPAACQIVTTVGDPSLAEAEDWEAFLEIGDAGLVAGASAAIAPQSGVQLYFNEQVQPDPSLSATTTDGGVLWLNVAAGEVYTLTAEDPSGALTFPEVEIDCQAGRFINASPPQGLTAIP